MVRDESGAFFFFFFLLACKVFSKDETNEEREREKEGTWKKLHRREVGRWAMMIFHSTRHSELSL